MFWFLFAEPFPSSATRKKHGELGTSNVIMARYIEQDGMKDLETIVKNVTGFEVRISIYSHAGKESPMIEYEYRQGEWYLVI